ncbi:hypothetical protein [Endozoicomonas sp. ALB091]
MLKMQEQFSVFCPITTRSYLCWRYWLPSGLLEQDDESLFAEPVVTSG